MGDVKCLEGRVIMAAIYIVEDDKNILEIEMFALKNSGYQVEGFPCASAFYSRLDTLGVGWTPSVR